jgi:hypothetical protein
MPCIIDVFLFFSFLSFCLLRGKLLQQLHQLHGIRPNQLIHLLSTLEKQERRHRADTKLATQLRQLVDVELDKVDLVFERLLLGQSVGRKSANAHQKNKESCYEEQ